MRQLTTVELVDRFARALGKAARNPTRVFFTGGVTAILHGWRETTIDVDLMIEPDSDEILQAIPRLKEGLQINIELASPDDFIPEVPGGASARSSSAKKARSPSSITTRTGRRFPRSSEDTTWT